MTRKVFAEWQQDLGDDELAKALAAAGIYVAAGPPSRRIDVGEAVAQAVERSGEEPIRCIYAPHLSKNASTADRLVDAWDRVKRTSTRPRIEIVHETKAKRLLGAKDPAWFAKQLQASAVGAASSFFSLEPWSKTVEWEWPLRVGFLRDSASQLMKSSCLSILARQDWLQPLIDPVDTATHLQALELLILPGNLSEALQLLENSPYPVYAYLVAALGGRGNLDWQSVAQKKDRITALTQAHAVIVAHESLETWLQTFVGELAHDAPLDIAACNTTIQEPKICWLSTPMLQSVRPSQFASSLMDRAESCDLDARVSLPSRAAGMLGVIAQPASLGRIVDQFGKSIQSIGYFHGTHGAAVTAALNKAMRQTESPRGVQFVGVGDPFKRIRVREPLAHSEPPQPQLPEPRHLQAEVYAVLSGKRLLRVRAGFVSKKRHEINVFIGKLQPDSEALSDMFPTEKLPPTDSGGHTLTVVFHEPNLMKHPQLSTLFLPVQGDTANCHFDLWVPNRSRFVEARITVLHENRVLQTGVLHGEVQRLMREEQEATWQNQVLSAKTQSAELPANEPNENTLIRFTLSGAVHRAMAELDRRSRFDAAFVLNHTDNETGVSDPGMLGVAGNRSGYVPLTDVDVGEASEGIYKALDTGEWEFKDYQGLTAKGTTKLLRSLAIMGSRIYKFVVGGGKFPDVVATAKRIQVVAAKRGSKFPFEFIYEFATPARDAPLCPHAETALLTGVCPSGCQTHIAGKAPYVCPLGFWGLNRVIEWHIFSEEHAKAAKGAAFRVDIDDGPRNNELLIAAPALMAYSKKIDEADATSIPWFKGHAAIHSVIVDSWPDWIKNVKDLAPKVLVLLVHTDTDGVGTVLEVGPPPSFQNEDDYRLATDYLSGEYICSPGGVPPIVLLLGCTTNQAKFEFTSVASNFEYCGAKILVATSNLIYGPNAVRLADLLLAKLHDLQDGENFGEAMLSVRRTALAEGNPMVLCLSAYGDADWRLRKGRDDVQH
jgi:hypothetical protein